MAAENCDLNIGKYRKNIKSIKRKVFPYRFLWCFKTSQVHILTLRVNLMISLCLKASDVTLTKCDLKLTNRWKAFSYLTQTYRAITIR